METEMKNDQNNWLRLQGNIIDMSEKLNHQMNESHLAEQRKIFHISFDLNSLDSFSKPNIFLLNYRIVGD